MKITKNRLKQIIKEELKKILEGDVIPFQPRFGGRVDGASDETYEDEGDVIELPDPLKDMIEYFKLDKVRQDKLRKLVAGPLEGSTHKIFNRVGKMDSSLGKAKERVPLAIDAFYNEYFETE